MRVKIATEAEMWAAFAKALREAQVKLAKASERIRDMQNQWYQEEMARSHGEVEDVFI